MYLDNNVFYSTSCNKHDINILFVSLSICGDRSIKTVLPDLQILPASIATVPQPKLTLPNPVNSTFTSFIKTILVKTYLYGVIFD